MSNAPQPNRSPRHLSPSSLTGDVAISSFGHNDAPTHGGMREAGHDEVNPAPVTASVSESLDISEGALGAFIEEWRLKSEARGWDPVWTDTETGEVVRFNDIADESELLAASARAEAQYLAMVAEEKEAGTKAWMERGKTELEARVLVERELWQNELYYLTKFILGRDRLVFHLHFYMCETMRRLPLGYRGLREFPRDTYKTTCMGEGYAVQLILRDPNVRIAYIMNSKDNATSKVRVVRDHFCNNTMLRAVFPELCPTTRKEEGKESSWTTPGRSKDDVHGEATITALGVGKRAASAHFTHAICDDFWDQDSVRSEATQRQVREDYQGITWIMEEPAVNEIIFIGTRFAHDDLTTTLVKDPSYHCVIVSGITPKGRALFPERLTMRFMYAYAMGSSMGMSGEDSSDTGIYAFSCQVMLNPTNESFGLDRRLVRGGSWESMKRLELEGRASYRKVLLYDSSVGKGRSSDYIAIMCIAIDHLKRIWVIDYVRERMTPGELIKEVFRMHDVHRPEIVVRQKTALETTIFSFVNDVLTERKKRGKPNVIFHEYGLKSREKKARITASLQPRLSQGLIIFADELPHRESLLKELDDHPNSQFDDGIDTLSMVDDPVVGAAPRFIPVAAERALPGADDVGEVMARDILAKHLDAQTAWSDRRAPRKRRKRAGGVGRRRRW